MNRSLLMLGICIATFAISVAAQTNVTNGNDGAANTVPVYTGSSTLGNSPISIAGGNVVIGSTASGNALELITDVGPTSEQLRVISSGSNAGVWLAPNAGGSYWNSITQSGDQVIAFTGAGGFGTGNLVIAPWTSGLSGIRMTSSGNIGIGTSNPGAILEVNGNVKLTANSGSSITFQDGTTQSTAWTGTVCGGDYAESVSATGDRNKYGPGDVLVLDPDHPSKVLKSMDAYSTAVAGIYSTRPGTVGRRQLTTKSADEVPMAMIGIVPAKVSAENGPIHVGDLLVSSTKAGYAMKGTDRSRMLGAVLGKAMESLDSETGVIEVLVTLQ